MPQHFSQVKGGCSSNAQSSWLDIYRCVWGDVILNDSHSAYIFCCDALRCNADFTVPSVVARRSCADDLPVQQSTAESNDFLLCPLFLFILHAFLIVDLCDSVPANCYSRSESNLLTLLQEQSELEIIVCKCVTVLGKIL